MILTNEIERQLKAIGRGIELDRSIENATGKRLQELKSTRTQRNKLLREYGKTEMRLKMIMLEIAQIDRIDLSDMSDLQ